MSNSLTKTTVALLLAALAVLMTAGIAMRDFIADVSAPCPGTLTVERPADAQGSGGTQAVELRVVPPAERGFPPPTTPSFRVVYDEVRGSYPQRYKNVRIEWMTDGPCVCGAVPIELGVDATPYNVNLAYSNDSHQFAVTSQGSPRVTFEIAHTPSHHVQTARILSRRHLSLAVSFAAFLALGVAWLRQRKARSYALVMNAWREAELTSGQMIQSETGEMLGALQSTSRRIWQRAGKVLVAPEALGGSGLYRDVPVIEPRYVARGDHAEWQRATMMRLRDAQALAVLSTLTSVAALAAHFLA